MLSHRFSNSPLAKIALEENTLAVIPLAKACEASDLGVINAGIEHAGLQQINEIWSVKDKVTRGISKQSQWSKTSEIICVSRWLSEEDCRDIEKSTYEAYVSIFSVLNDHGFMHPFRFWNYLPDINTGMGDAETYKRFCTGRLRAFTSLRIEPSYFPSASALGHHSRGAVIYVFASANKASHFTNNKQINAYDYPRQYGISSPSFARATALHLGDVPYLFISGTASITGHKSVEANNFERQLEVTANNIEHLLATANPDNRTLSTFKVYLRYPHHFQQAQNWLNGRYPNVTALITVADICRLELLVEIECFCQ